MIVAGARNERSTVRNFLENHFGQSGFEAYAGYVEAALQNALLKKHRTSSSTLAFWNFPAK